MSLKNIERALETLKFMRDAIKQYEPAAEYFLKSWGVENICKDILCECCPLSGGGSIQPDCLIDLEDDEGESIVVSPAELYEIIVKAIEKLEQFIGENAGNGKKET